MIEAMLFLEISQVMQSRQGKKLFSYEWLVHCKNFKDVSYLYSLCIFGAIMPECKMFSVF